MSFVSSVRRTRRNNRARNGRGHSHVDAAQASGVLPEAMESRRLFAAILWSETFDRLPLGPSVEETNAGENVWTKVPPTGWDKDDSGVPGYNNPDLPTPEPDNNGKTEWIGWTFTDKEWWSTQVDTQNRGQFTKARGAVMVADPDEWDDETHPGKNPLPSWDVPEDLYTAKMTTSDIPLAGAVPGTLKFEYDSSWRPEGFDDGSEGVTRINNQTGIIEAIYSNGVTEKIQHWDSDSAGPFFKSDDSAHWNEHVAIPLNIPAGATSVKFRFTMANAANDWWWAVDNLAVTGTPDVTNVRLIGVSGTGEGGNPTNNESLFELAAAGGTVTATRLLGLPSVPDGDVIAFNPATGLLYHASGGHSTSDEAADPGFRDNHFLETVDVVGGTNARTTVFNANSEQFGSPGPRPEFVLPTTRRTNTQLDPEFGTGARGPNEYTIARDFTWSAEDNAFLVASPEGIYKVTAAGVSTFIGDPMPGVGGTSGLTFFNIGSTRTLIVGSLGSSEIYHVDPATGAVTDLGVVLVDPDSQPIPGIHSLAESPDGNTLYGIARDPADPNKRNLVTIDPITGLTTKLGELTAPITDLAFVYSRGAAPTAAKVTQVFVNGPTLTAGAAAFKAAAGVDATFGYAVPGGPVQTTPLSWVGGINSVSIRFDTDVASALAQGDLAINGSAGPVATTGFTYDAATRTGTWTFAAVTRDKLRFVLDDAGISGLDGEWTNPTEAFPGVGGDSYPSGDGTAGGDFNFRVNVLNGDVSGDGQVNATDVAEVKRRLTRRPNDGVTDPLRIYTIFSDITGDGVINANDLAQVKGRLTQRINTLPNPATALLFA